MMELNKAHLIIANPESRPALKMITMIRKILAQIIQQSHLKGGLLTDYQYALVAVTGVEPVSEP